MEWIDLSAHGLRLDACRDEVGALFTILRGADTCPDAATRLGYAPDEAGRWRRAGGLPPFGQTLREFPQADVCRVERADVELPLDAPFNPVAGRRGAAADFRAVALAGRGLDLGAFRAYLMAEGIPEEFRRPYTAAAEALLATLGPTRFLGALRNEYLPSGVAAGEMLEALRAGDAATAADTLVRLAPTLTAGGNPRLNPQHIGWTAERLRGPDARTDGPIVDALRDEHGPRAVVREFLAAGGNRRIANDRGMLEYAIVHLREHQARLDNDLPPRPPAMSAPALEATWRRTQEGFAPVAQRANPADSLTSNLRKLVKLFGLPFYFAALRDPAANRAEVFESHRVAYLPVSTRAHIWAPVSRLARDLNARAAVLPPEDGAPQLPAPGV